MRTIILLALGAALAACTPTMAKNGINATSDDQDHRYCGAYASGHAGFSPAGLAGAAATIGSINGLYLTCMMDRGWREAGK